MWLNPDQYQGGNDTLLYSDQAVVRFTGSIDTLDFFIVNDAVGTNKLDVDTTFPLDTWQHLVLTFDNQMMRAYHDGQLVAETTSHAGVGIGGASCASKIGSNCSSNDAFDGSLDEVRIYNRALTPAEVSALYHWAPGPVAHYKLDDNTGTTALDTSGFGNTGTLTGGPTWTQGKYGSAVSFDGTNDYILVSDTDSFSFGDGTEDKAFSISAWVNANSLSSDKYIISKFAAGGSEWRLDMNNGKPALILYDQSAVGFIGRYQNSSLDTNRWYHITGTYDGSGNTQGIKVYVDGIQKDDTDSIAGGSYVAMENKTTPVSIGAMNTPDRFWDGLIDDVRIYNYPRTQSQILADMHADPPGTVGLHPVLALDFEEGTGTTTYDTSGYANHGTLTNMASPATSTSGWSNSGKFGKALAFNGTDDSVTVSDSASISPTNANTISLWLQPQSTLNSGTGRKDIIYKLNSYYIILNFSTSDGAISFINHIGGNQVVKTTTTTWNANTWYHILGTYDGSRMKIYVNGKLEGTLEVTGSISDSTYLLSIGDSAQTASFPGTLDELKIYPYALTESEVALDYNRGSTLTALSTSTASDGTTPDSSASRAYCVPGDTATCDPPVAEWLLDEATGTTAQDTSGGGNTGTLTGGPTWTQGKFGKAVSFDGTDDYINLPSSFGDFGSTDDFTISTWFKNSNTNSDWDLFFSKYTDGTNWWYFGLLNTHQVSLSLLPSGGTVTTDNTYNDGQWHHATVTRSDSGTDVYMYIDGQLVKSNTSLTAYNTAKNNGTSIGRYPGGGHYFNGLIDQLRIYDYARTPAQIAYEYNRGAPIAWYKFDECQGTTINDWAPNADGGFNGNNGTLTIGASGTNTSAGTCEGSSGEAWADGASGRINGALEFDGTDDYIQITSSIEPKQVSVAAWAKSNTANWSDYGYIVSQRTSLANNGFILHPNAGSKRMYFYIGNTTGIYNSGYYEPEDITQWHHYVGTYDGETVKLYVDGVLRVSNTSPSGDITYAGTNTKLTIGSDDTDNSIAASRYGDGHIDDVRIYNYALTETQIKNVYNGGALTFQ